MIIVNKFNFKYLLFLKNKYNRFNKFNIFFMINQELIKVMNSISEYSKNFTYDKKNHLEESISFFLKNLNNSKNQIKLTITFDKWTYSSKKRYLINEELFRDSILIESNLEIFNEFKDFIKQMNDQYNILVDIKEELIKNDQLEDEKNKEKRFFNEVTHLKMNPRTQWVVLNLYYSKQINSIDDLLFLIHSNKITEFKGVGKKIQDELKEVLKKKLYHYQRKVEKKFD